MIEEKLIKVTERERRTFSIAEVCQQLGVSRNFVLSQIRGGQLRGRRLGRRIVIVRQDLDSYLEHAETVGTKIA